MPCQRVLAPVTGAGPPHAAQAATVATVQALPGWSLWGSKTRPPVLTWALCGPLVLVDEAAEDRLTLDPLLGRVARGIAPPGVCAGLGWPGGDG